MLKAIASGIVLLACSSDMLATAASFDCAKAASEVEKTICSNPQLSAADETLAEFYERLTWLKASDKDVLKHIAAEQQDWLQKRRNTCVDNACISAAYTARQDEIKAQIKASIDLKAASSASIELEAPLGGWRHSAREPVSFVQPIGFPDFVDEEEPENALALIKGHIANTPRLNREQEKPLNLVVNGIAMPLKTTEGRFERAYTFGSGSNSVEIRSPDGVSLARTQFFEAYREKPSPRLRIVLTWDSDGTVVDLHVITPDGQHCYWGNRMLDNGSAIDVDLVLGYGPVIFTMPAVLAGTYQVYVNYWSDDNYEQPGEAHGVTLGKVAVVIDEGTADEKMETVTVPLRHPGDLALAYAFTYP